MKSKLIISFFFLTLIGCLKQETQNDIYYININPELKSQAFKTGSYWIYQNDSTSKIDCTFIYLDNTDIDNVPYVHGSSYSYECYEMFYHYHFTTNGYSSYWDRMFGDQIIKNPIQCYNGHQLCGPIVYATSSFTGMIYFDSLKIGNNIFYKVQEVSIDSTQWYTAKSIGVIKKVVHDSIDKGTWNLLRWKIVK